MNQSPDEAKSPFTLLMNKEFPDDYLETTKQYLDAPLMMNGQRNLSNMKPAKTNKLETP